MVVRNVKKVQSARPNSAVRKPPTGHNRVTGGAGNILNRDLAVDNDEDAEAWFQVEEAGAGDQGASVPPKEA